MEMGLSPKSFFYLKAIGKSFTDLFDKAKINWD